MKPVRDPEAAARLQRAFELYEMAEDLMRQNLRRRFPEENEDQIEQRVLVWLHHRPGADIGDAGGPIQVRRVFE